MRGQQPKKSGLWSIRDVLLKTKVGYHTRAIEDGSSLAVTLQTILTENECMCKDLRSINAMLKKGSDTKVVQEYITKRYG